MRKQLQAFLRGGVSSILPPPEPNALRTHRAHAFHCHFLRWLSAQSNRRVTGTLFHSSSRGTPAREWRDLLQGFDTLYPSKAGRRKGNRVYEQHSSEVPESQTLTSE